MNKNKTKYVLKNKKEIEEIINILSKEYPGACCSLKYNNALELTIALILAAQCTDNMVNKIIPILFTKYSDVYSLANADLNDVQRIIKSCGFYINKSKNIINTAKKIVNDFNGSVPDNMKDLCTLSGIGRKSSNIILQECFNTNVGIAVDTHVTRLSYRIGFTKETIQDKIELDLMHKVSKGYWNRINHIFVFHGRAICNAKKPACDICPINNLCPKNGVQ